MWHDKIWMKKSSWTDSVFQETKHIRHTRQNLLQLNRQGRSKQAKAGHFHQHHVVFANHTASSLRFMIKTVSFRCRLLLSCHRYEDRIWCSRDYADWLILSIKWLRNSSFQIPPVILLHTREEAADKIKSTNVIKHYWHDYITHWNCS